MKKFIKQVFFFTLIFCCLFTCIILTTNIIVNNKADFKISKEKKYVLFGHSQPECAFNDSLISNFKNFSNAGETYFYTFQKIKQILPQNPQIETVFLEFTNNKISIWADKDIWSNKYMRLRYPRYASFMNLEDNLFLMTKNVKGYAKVLPISIKYNLIRMKLNDYFYINKIGGYKYLVRKKTDSILKTMNKTGFSIYPEYQKMSVHEIHYLEKIIQFCKEMNKKVYLVRSPYHKKSFYSQNEEALQLLKKQKFDTIKFLDFKDFPLDNSEYGDLDHLNHKGAKKFSKWFNTLLKKGLLDSINKQQIIDKKI
ncbi:hypothetical protein [Confluentibacter flavum]|uniref:SGNH/GDSL hydrolase family protein n=1 Tax=Confluentibacter flavum TaxID=1909700 RepID=A0A2N3HP27_9FLAO|nr:hypothetical protein [Confluentibacter flavum]PKQ46729.1 hypothetical protein CSW08_01645 [Confluentibacter flavum]